jgi:hypothetical protein
MTRTRSPAEKAPVRNSSTIWPVPSAPWRRTAATAVMVDRGRAELALEGPVSLVCGSRPGSAGPPPSTYSRPTIH